MQKSLVKKSLGVLCALLCIWTLSVPCLAADLGPTGPMRMDSITSIQCTVVANNGKVTGRVSVIGHREVDRCKIFLAIQKKDGNRWISVASWSEDVNGRNATLSKTIDGKKGVTYRVNATITAWQNGKPETKTITSAEKVA